MKKIIKNITTYCLCALLCFGVLCNFACNKDNETSFSFIDQAGRKVEITEVPDRIVSGYYISTSLCIALGLSDKLVGVETGRDKRPIYSLINNQTINNAVDVGSAKNFDLERCCSANPDLVILPYKAKDSATTLEELKINAIVVMPETQEGFIEMINLIARITNTEDRARELIDYIDAKIDFITDKLQDVANNSRPTVFMGSASGYLTTSPKDMYQSNIINLAGGKNCGDIFSGNNKVEVDKEQFISFNPDVIIIPTNANANGYAYDINDYLTDTALSEVSAIKNRKIYYMPKGFESWDSPTPSSILGALYILHVLYPELYSLDEFKDEVCSFYNRFYNLQIDKQAII